MLCPVCGIDHLPLISDIPKRSSHYYAPCELCSGESREKGSPPQYPPLPFCSCNKRHLDEVTADIHDFLIKKGVFSGDEALSRVGIPVISPGIFLRSPPFIPVRSLLLLTDLFTEPLAEEVYDENKFLLGVVSWDGSRPGAGDLFGNDHDPVTCRLLSGCDVRGDLFLTSSGSVLIYKMQHATHLEFPKGMDPKIRSLESHMQRAKPGFFLDACSGAGTLGIAAGVLGARKVMLCDVWYAAAYFSAFNLLVNKDRLGIDSVTFYLTLEAVRSEPVRKSPVLVAKALGKKIEVEVWHGDVMALELPDNGQILVAFDPFDKNDMGRNDSLMAELQTKTGGEVFIP